MKSSFKITFTSILISCFFFSCAEKKTGEEKLQASILEKMLKNTSSSALQVNEYMKWVENKDNGLRVEKNIGEITFSALYKPYEYLALMELKKETPAEKEVKDKINSYEGLQYFTFKIAANNEQKEILKVGIASDQEYYSRLEYFSFQMQNDFKLIDGSDTLPCVLYHFERVYGLAPYATLVLGFPLTKSESEAGKPYKNKTIGYSDKVFGAGNIYMTIREEDLNRIPGLQLN